MPFSGRVPRNRPTQTSTRQRLRHESTRAERTLWQLLRRRQAGGLRWRRQFGVGPYVLDFYCPEARLAVEVDGAVHTDPEQRRADQARTEALTLEGIAVLRVENGLVFDWPEAVVTTITEAATRRLSR